MNPVGVTRISIPDIWNADFLILAPNWSPKLDGLRRLSGNNVLPFAQTYDTFALTNHLKNTHMGIIIYLVVCMNVIGYMCGGN